MPTAAGTLPASTDALHELPPEPFPLRPPCGLVVMLEGTLATVDVYVDCNKKKRFPRTLRKHKVRTPTPLSNCPPAPGVPSVQTMPQTQCQNHECNGEGQQVLKTLR